eukprot:c3990_g1_i1.p1 GENE.c3990_g1_i1~~c3990_g1_i1.p1  ORF type:complete len:582 (+),score=101.47 c3990_g1_i1:54-1748(+)
MKAVVIVGVLCLSGHVWGSEHIGNPWRTTAFVKTNPNSLVQSEAEGQVSLDTLTDDALVSNKFGSTPVNIENLKNFIKQRGLSDLGLVGDLISRTACIIRLETSFGGSLNPTSLNDFLVARELSVSGGKDETFDRACDYLKQENNVQKLLGRDVVTISKEDLKLQLTKLGFISTSGTKSELVYRLGKALSDLSTIRKLLGDNEFDTSQLKDVLKSRGLPVEGTTNVLLDRLASYLVDLSSNSGMSVSTHCDLVLASSICVDGGKKVIAPDAAARGLIGRWTFDDAFAQDKSGFGHHPSRPPAVAEGLHGVGAAAKFDASSMLEIPHSDHFSSQDFCITFWFYLLADSTGQWRTVLHKGTRDQERTPTLFLEPQTRGLEFFVSTTDPNQPFGERVWSNTFLPLRRWTHVAACAEGRNLRLFINGILDVENTTIGMPVMNQGPLYVGNDPWRPLPGGVASYIDELRYYTRSLSSDEIQAQAQHALGGVEPAFIELGCMGCTLDTCPKSCRRGYRVCTQRDMYGGAYQVSRGMGWANSETRVWTAEDAKDGSVSATLGLCMCCREEE